MTELDKKEKEDPALSYGFALEINGVVEGFFTECAGLESERDIEEVKEGGENTYIHKFPGRLKYANVTLKRGVIASNDLWEWYLKGMDDGKVERQSVTVILFDQAGSRLKSWNLVNAYPVKWSGPSFKSDDNNVAVETLELVFDQLTLAA
jgi:phage tail-like protein